MPKSKVVDNDLRAAWLEALIARHDGRLSPRLLLDDSRDRASPFHGDFEWDDSDAAEQYRLAQAASIIRRWKGVVVRQNAQTKSLDVSVERRVQSPSGERKRDRPSYVPVEDIMADDALRADMVKTVVRELAAYRRRYAKLIELSNVWFAVDELVDTWGPEQQQEELRPLA